MVFSADIALAEKLLDVATFRHQVIAHNISNVNTPNFKRSEVSFEEALEALMKEDQDGGESDLTGTEVDAKNYALDSKKTLTQLKAESNSDLGISFVRSNAAFDYQWYANATGDYSPTPLSPGKTRADVIKSLTPEVVVDNKAGRLDGNNVSVDLEIGKMIKNTTLYNILISNISTEFRVLKNIITMR